MPTLQLEHASEGLRDMEGRVRSRPDRPARPRSARPPRVPPVRRSQRTWSSSSTSTRATRPTSVTQRCATCGPDARRPRAPRRAARADRRRRRDPLVRIGRSTDADRAIARCATREAGRSVAGMTRTALLTGAVCLAVAAPAAAEPVNGRIAYTTFESSADPAVGDIWTMNPDGADKVQAVFDPDLRRAVRLVAGRDADRVPQPAQQPVRDLDRRLSRARRRHRSPARDRRRHVDRRHARRACRRGSRTARGLLYRRTNAPGHDALGRLGDGPRRHESPARRGAARGPALSELLAGHEAAACSPPTRRAWQRRIDVMDVATGVGQDAVRRRPDDRRRRAGVVAGRPPDRVRERPGRRRRDLRHERRRLQRPADHAQHALGRGPGVVAGRHEVRVLARRRRPAPRYLDDERRRLGRPATDHVPGSRRVARLGRQSRPGRGRRDGPGDAVAAARQRRRASARSCPASRPTTRRARPRRSRAPPATRP